VKNIHRDGSTNSIYINIQFLSRSPLGIIISFQNLFELLFQLIAIQLLYDNYFVQNTILKVQYCDMKDEEISAAR
jgi:hypothetical protein